MGAVKNLLKASKLWNYFRGSDWDKDVDEYNHNEYNYNLEFQSVKGIVHNFFIFGQDSYFG